MKFAVTLISYFLSMSYVLPAWAATPTEVAQWLESHNTYRQLHGVGPLVWSDTVAASAQAFINTCPASHSGAQYGENLAWATYSASLSSVVTWWYSEEVDYDYANPGFSPATGHFSQVVWKGTTELGCAYNDGCTSGMYQGSHTAWVCQYNPPGNYTGQFADNVFPQSIPPAPDPTEQQESGKFAWTMFLPAITAANFNQDLNCGAIAGCYSGLFSDTCSGSGVTGRINLTVSSDCSFSSISSFGVGANGNITARNGAAYSGFGRTESDGCGEFTITCNDMGSAVSCNYTYGNGRTGSMQDAPLGQCKSENRIKTEALAGSWRFTYQIISAFTNDYELDLNEVKASSSSPGDFIILGQGEYGNQVIAGFDASLGDYVLLDSGTIIDRYFTFSYSGNGIVSGCYYQIDSDDGSWSSCHPMRGIQNIFQSKSMNREKFSSSQYQNELGRRSEVAEGESFEIIPKKRLPDNGLHNSYEEMKNLLEE